MNNIGDPDFLRNIDPKIADDCRKLHLLLGELDVENKKQNPDQAKILELMSKISALSHLLDIMYVPRKK